MFKELFGLSLSLSNQLQNMKLQSNLFDEKKSISFSLYVIQTAFYFNVVS